MDWKKRGFAVVLWILLFLLSFPFFCSCQVNGQTVSSPVHQPEPKHELAASPVSLPKVALPPMVQDVSPSFQPTVPTAQSPAPTVHTGWPRTISPSAQEPSEGPAAVGSSPTRSPVPHEVTNAHIPTTAPNQPPPVLNNPPMPPAVPNHNEKEPLVSPYEAPSPSPQSVVLFGRNQRTFRSISPHFYTKEPKPIQPEPVLVLPPPPPNLDCNWLQCSEPLTNPAPGSPCICVLPIKVGLHLSVTLYKFFPSVSEFAQEIASGIDMKLSQVRIMGANVATQKPEKTTVLIDLVPLGEKFDNNSAFLAFKKFWHKQIFVKPTLFGNYDVLYVLYPGLPPSPPASPAGISFADGAFGDKNNSMTTKPLGVNFRRPKRNVSHIVIALTVLSSFISLVVCIGAVWLLLLKLRDQRYSPSTTPHMMLPIFTNASGTSHVLLGNTINTTSAFLGSSFPTYSGSAKTFSLDEIERATGRFDDSRIIGEGGFGRVYKGILEDGTKVAVKVLKREDQQGEREFLAEVEMLSRLHHRNLVKLIGICTEEHVRCVVYELVPNDSLDSHLHGAHKGTAPLDWNARMKIALGAARALAYLHEDSSPPVIHRDFKSSNILLEDDYTPRVSDFGLARAAQNEGSGHISTRVMGTFGYVAPEYAMTGHLLVKSDVYSYGVVLLELLTGRKPVDMSQPQGQENLVAWARPLLASKYGLRTIIDPALGTSVPYENASKVAAIASMCVQPEASHRPFMGEVVQALKLICNVCDDNIESVNSRRNVLSLQEKAIRIATWSAFESNRRLSPCDILCMSETRNDSSLFQWCSSSGPRRSGRNRQFWERLRSLSTGSIRDRNIALELRANMECGGRWS